jgi:tRNA threonylcarbamoyladenosine biosynthesis protein TsaB
VTTGPGSFTGVRIGIAFARGLALALDIPAIGVGSLDALLQPLCTARESEGTIAARLDARRGEVYATVRDVASGATLIDAEALPVAELASRLRDARRPIVLTGSGAGLAAAAFDACDTNVVGEADAPAIADVVALALEANESAPPVPLYARSPDAKPQRDKAVARS